MLSSKRKWKSVKLFRSSVEKVYKKLETEGMRTNHPIMVGLLEVWGECPENGSGLVNPNKLSKEGRAAIRKIHNYKWSGFIS